MAYANPGIRVTVVDKDSFRIRRWQSEHLPGHEPGLSDIVRIARDGAEATGAIRCESVDGIALSDRAPNLFFSTDCERYISDADIVFLGVNTPTKLSGMGAGAATNMSIFESAMHSIAISAKPHAIIVEKSTVPCRTAQLVRDIVSSPGERADLIY